MKDWPKELSHLSIALHLQRVLVALHDVPRQVLAVPQAVAEVCGREDVVQPVQNLNRCGKAFLFSGLILTLSCFQDDTSSGFWFLRSCKAKNPVNAIKGNLNEVALVLERSPNSLEAKGESGSYAKGLATDCSMVSPPSLH